MFEYRLIFAKTGVFPSENLHAVSKKHVEQSGKQQLSHADKCSKPIQRFTDFGGSE